MLRVQDFTSKLMASLGSRKFVLISLAAFIVTIPLARQYIFSDNPRSRIPAVPVKQGKVVVKIVETGELRAQDQVTISAINDKQILWLAPEGSWVEEGDTLVIYESQKYVISKGEAESNLEVAKSELIQALSDLEAQRAKEEGARQKYESMLQLAKEGFAVQSEVDQARLNYIELKSKTRSFEAAVNAARANVRRAERMLQQQIRKLNESFTLAPRAGIVVYAYVGDEETGKKIEVGMIPFEGQDLMYLPDVSSMLVDAQISEVELHKIKVGMPARITLDAYPDAVFSGEIIRIGDLAKRKISRITGKPTGAKVFDVTIKVLEQDKRLKPGLTATVEIIVNEYDDVLYVPLEAIFLDELDQTHVYVSNQGYVEKRLVRLGESNDRVVIVTEGLQEGELVFLARPENF